jgi:hypothetical protein
MNKLLITSLTLVLVLSIGSVAAHKGFFDEETHNTIISAIENNDYQAWAQAHKNMINEENFELAKERYQNGMQNGHGNRGQGRVMREIMDSADYDTYVRVAEERGFEPISEENFQTLQKVHNARVAGDYELATQLSEGLDNLKGFGKCKGMGR